jgi:hypothetical protein
MKRIWHYLSNQFLVVTKNNFKKALKISRQHDICWLGNAFPVYAGWVSL